MRISEMLSSPMPEQQQQHENEGRSLKVIEEIETSIRQFEESHNNKSLTLELLSSNLDKSLSRLNALSSATPLSNSIKLQIWKLSYRLWNACVDLSNATITTTSSSQVQVQAKLRQFAADLLLLARDVSGIPSHLFKSASFYYKTGLIWHDLNKFDLAANCFERATDLTATANVNEISDVGEQRLLLDLNIARSKTAWEVSERNLAIILLNRSKNLLFGSPESFKALANQYLVFGKLVLSKQQEQKTMEAIQEALKLMNEALDLCDKGLRMVKRPDEDDSAAYLSLKTMRSKTLRFMAAAHLQGEEFQSVLKCIRFLREEDEQHPSLPVLAMKAWLGLGKCVEAEKELRGMVVNKGIPESIWLSAVEAYFQAAGGVAAAETAKGLFLGLLGRCHVSANAAVRVAHRVISGSGVSSGCSRARAKVVAELVSDERVMLLFAAGAGQDGEANATTAMHAVLWNCGADHFRAKDYETSAEMFEKSMLYVPHNVENKIIRAKCFRVLCLCHLGLSHLDQAHEYVDEAEKLHPNIACAFLKFKIHLQKKDENGAINQLKAMTSCLDFTPDFLILSAHEAIASTALPVAISSLSNLLNFYSPGKPMPTPQVVVLRTLVVLLSRDPGNEHEILNFIKLAQTKMLELNPENFFGKGEVGRRERNWFAVISWNYGSRAGIQKKYELCAEFLVLASQFYGVTMNGEAEGNHAMVCRCLILSVSAMIASEKQGNAALSDSEVNRALELLNKAGKVLALTSCGTQQADDPTNIEPNFFFMHTCNSYEIQSRLADHIHQDQQLILIKNFASSKACTPQYLLQLGLNALQGQRPNYSVADYTLNTCLSTLLSSPFPEYKTIFVIVRKLIGLAGFKKGDANDEAYSLYKQAYRIMVGLKEDQYPTEEAKWLATTAWNRAALPVRIGQIGTAKKWMRMGLELAQHVSAASSYKECMDKFLVEFEAKFDGHDNV